MDWTQIISTFGVMPGFCIGLAWYVKYLTDKNDQRVDKMQEEHKEEIQKVTEALNNNTLALQRLVDKLDADKDIKVNKED